MNIKHVLAGAAMLFAAAGQSATITLYEDTFESGSSDFDSDLSVISAPATPTGASGSYVGSMLIGNTSDGSSKAMIQATDFTSIAIDSSMTSITVDALVALTATEVGNAQVKITLGFKNASGDIVNGGASVGGVWFNSNSGDQYVTYNGTIDTPTEAAEIFRIDIKTFQVESNVLSDQTMLIDNIKITAESTAVPEPATVGLLALSGLMLFRRRH